MLFTRSMFYIRHMDTNGIKLSQATYHKANSTWSSMLQQRCVKLLVYTSRSSTKHEGVRCSSVLSEYLNFVAWFACWVYKHWGSLRYVGNMSIYVNIRKQKAPTCNCTRHPVEFHRWCGGWCLRLQVFLSMLSEGNECNESGVRKVKNLEDRPSELHAPKRPKTKYFDLGGFNYLAQCRNMLTSWSSTLPETSGCKATHSSTPTLPSQILQPSDQKQGKDIQRP